jgi:hypothetical protein
MKDIDNNAWIVPFFIKLYRADKVTSWRSFKDLVGAGKLDETLKELDNL